MMFKTVRGQVLQNVPCAITIQTAEIPLTYRYHRKARRLLLRLDYTDNHPESLVSGKIYQRVSEGRAIGIFRTKDETVCSQNE